MVTTYIGFIVSVIIVVQKVYQRIKFEKTGKKMKDADYIELYRDCSNLYILAFGAFGIDCFLKILNQL